MSVKYEYFCFDAKLLENSCRKLQKPLLLLNILKKRFQFLYSCSSWLQDVEIKAMKTHEK